MERGSDLSSLRKFNVKNKTDRLRSVMLGTFFMPEAFTGIKNPRIREPLMQVADEINRDLEHFESVLKREGCKVVRTVQPSSDITSYGTNINTWAPRNCHVVIGGQLVQLQNNASVTDALVEYSNDILDLESSNDAFFDSSMAAAKSNYNADRDTWYSRKKYEVLEGSDWPTYHDYVTGNYEVEEPIKLEMQSFADDMMYWTNELGPINGPNVMCLDDKIVVDANEYCDYAGWLARSIDDPRTVVQITTRAGHTDGAFMILGNNTIIGINNIIDYQATFPGYHVIGVPEIAYQNHIHEFNLMKSKVNGKWWIPGEEYNQDLIDFVEQVLSVWVGRAEESVFDVNVLPLDNKTVFVSRDDANIREQLKMRGIDSIVIPWRHRFFIDNGLHCITLDLERE